MFLFTERGGIGEDIGLNLLLLYLNLSHVIQGKCVFAANPNYMKILYKHFL